MNEDEILEKRRIEEEKEEDAARRREMLRQEEQEEALEAEYQSRREEVERNEVAMRRIKEDAECLNDSINSNIKSALASLESIAKKNKRVSSISHASSNSSTTSFSSNVISTQPQVKQTTESTPPKIERL